MLASEQAGDTMSDPVYPSFEPVSAVESPPVFVPYTAFKRAEELLEEHLGQRAKVLLPPNYRAGFVRWLPWIAVVFLPFHAAALLLLLGISSLAMFVGSTSIVFALVSVGIFVLELIALPGLFARSRRGWTFYTYARVAGLVLRLFSFSLIGLITGVLFLWVAFQVKYEYR
jgi:hypothetical protein